MIYTRMASSRISRSESCKPDTPMEIAQPTTQQNSLDHEFKVAAEATVLGVDVEKIQVSTKLKKVLERGKKKVEDPSSSSATQEPNSELASLKEQVAELKNAIQSLQAWRPNLNKDTKKESHLQS